MEALGLIAIIIITLSIALLIQYNTMDSRAFGSAQGFIRRPDNGYNAFFDEFDKIFDRGIKSEKIKAVQECLDSLEHLYSETDVKLGTNGNRVCTADIADLRSHLEGLEEDKWHDKADKYLQEFIDCYEEIMSGAFDNFNDVELLFKTKKKCINEWQKYFAVDLSPYRTRMHPKKYFRDTLEELGIYDPCMESHATLEKKLSEKVQSMRPEYKRKMKLYGIIVNYVCQKNSMPRSELMRTAFEGFTVEETKTCYRALMKQDRLVEIKMGNTCFVSLSDKEAAKKHDGKPIKAVVLSNSQKAGSAGNHVQIRKKETPNSELPEAAPVDENYDLNGFISLLEKNKLNFVDKRKEGGCLWIEDREGNEKLFSHIYVNSKRPRRANSTRNFDGKPGWYIK